MPVSCSRRMSAPSEQIDPRFAFVNCTLLVPKFDASDLARAAAKRNGWSVPTGANDRADGQNLLATVAEMNNYSFEANGASGHAQLKRIERASVVNVNLVV